MSHFLDTKLEELSPFAHQGTLEQVTPDPLLASGGGFIPQPGYTHRVAPHKQTFEQEKGAGGKRGGPCQAAGSRSHRPGSNPSPAPPLSTSSWLLKFAKPQILHP